MSPFAILQKGSAGVRFLSVELLLCPIPQLPVLGIGWVIVGGESGPGARAMEADWVRQIRDRCTRYAVPFFFTQWGGVQKSRTGRILDGRTWDEFPRQSVKKKATGQKKDRWPELCKLVEEDEGLPTRESGPWAEEKLYFWNR